MKRQLAVLLFAGIAGLGVGCSKSTNDKATSGEAKAADLKALTVDEVSTKIAANDGKTFVYDNNSPESYAKGHVPGAKWVDDEKVTADVLPSDKNATLVFYCHNET